MPWADAPEVLTELDTLYLEEGRRPLEIEQARVQKSMVLLKFRGIDTMEAAAQLRGQLLYLDREGPRAGGGDLLCAGSAGAFR